MVWGSYAVGLPGGLGFRTLGLKGFALRFLVRCLERAVASP